MNDTDKKYDELKEDKQMNMISNERLKEIDGLYIEKCEEVNELKEEIRRLKSIIHLQKSKRIYISGPITGVSKSEAEASFRNAEQKIEAAGFIAINPYTLINGKGKLTWEDYIKMDLAILRRCAGIYMLNGWQNSRGACIEKEYADRHGIPEVKFI